jgi:alcohol dehydrogenase class IV
MTISRFAFPTDIHFGAGARKLVGRHLRDRGLARPLIVTDRGLAALPFIGELRRDAAAAGLDAAIYAGVAGNPGSPQVMDGAAAYRAHQADCVIGIGGGAALDVAKVVGLMATHPGDVLEYAWDHPQARPLGTDLPTFVALPTTAGTGSEVGRSSVISDPVSRVKRVLFGPGLLAKAVFADPELTLGLPRHITAATGMDALTHNVESYLSPSFHPLCDGIALEGARLAAGSLPSAVREPDNLAARSDRMMSSMMGAIAFQKDLGAVHSCAHALGTVCDMHHGLANALMIDTVLAWNAAGGQTRKFDALAHAVGVEGGAAGFIDWLRRLKAELGFAANLRAAGVTPDLLPRLVQVAFADSCHRTNPRACSAADFDRLFEEAM